MQSSTKDEILKMLIEANEHPVSGQQLADHFQISRTAIWKHIQRLQQDGFIIDTVKKQGYVLQKQSIQQLTIGEIDSFLQTESIGRTLFLYEEVTSTQQIAHELIAENTPHGTVIVAEKQTAGRGRLMREWKSAEQKGLWFTVVLKPDCLPHEAPQFTLVAAVSIVNAIQSLYPNIDAQIKWPNDILINGKKCTGILTEMVAEPDRIKALLIGIGVNVNHDKDDFESVIQPIATSLKEALGEVSGLNRAQLLARILYYLENYSEMYIKHGFARIKPLWEEASCTIGNQVRATTLKQVVEGRAIGITDNGVLRIEQHDGSIAEVYSADIEIL